MALGNGRDSRLALEKKKRKLGHMKKTYVISWRSRSGPAIGQGKKLLDREEAERLADELNQEYPDFMHEAIDISAERIQGEQSVPEPALEAAAA